MKFDVFKNGEKVPSFLIQVEGLSKDEYVFTFTTTVLIEKLEKGYAIYPVNYKKNLKEIMHFKAMKPQKNVILNGNNLITYLMPRNYIIKQ